MRYFNATKGKWILTALLAVISLTSTLFADGQAGKGRTPAKPAALRAPANPERIRAIAFPQNTKERRKLGASLESALEAAETRGAAAGLQQLKAAASTPNDSSGRVSVVIRPAAAQDLAGVQQALASAGAEVVRSAKGAMKVNLPLDKIAGAAALPQVRSVRALRPPRKKAFAGEGLGLTQANAWHSFGFTGAGVKVAVIDSGFMSLAALVAAGELPSGYVPVNLSADPDMGDSDEHGSACAEIIHDLAPGAELHLIKIDDITDLAEAVHYCATAGVAIVSCSLGFDVINFHDGVAHDNWYTSVADHPVTAVNQADAAGILFAVAAGNEQQQHSLINWGASGDFLQWAANGDDLNILYDWNGSTAFAAGEPIYVLLTWNRWPLTDDDYDLSLLHYNAADSAWEIVAASMELQDGGAGSYPAEELYHITAKPGLYAVSVDHYSSTSAPDFILRYYGISYPYYWGYDNYQTPVPGSLSIPGDAAAAFTVGAVHRADYPAGPAAYYSSLGPNNRAFTGGTAAVKPDLCAPSSITSAAYGGVFSGTSASTPHAAGLAALVKSVYPYLTVNQIKAYLEKYCSDIAPAGKDNTNGAGAAQLPTLLAVIEGEALKATAFLRAGGGAEVHFTGIPGGQYTVMARESLADGTWQSVGTATVAPDGTASFTDPGPLPPTRFYKIVKP